MSQIFKYNIEHQLKHIVRDILSHEALRFLKFFNETKLVLQLQILCQVCLKLSGYSQYRQPGSCSWH